MARAVRILTAVLFAAAVMALYLLVASRGRPL
jgi:hypothetical protein